MADYKDSLDFTRKLATTKLDCGLTLSELAGYDDIAMWWFARFDLIDLLLHMPDECDAYRPTELKFHSIVCSLPLWMFSFLNFCFDLTRKIFIKSILLFCRKNKIEAGLPRKKILFTAEDIRWRKMKDYETGESRKTDTFFDPLLNILKDDYTLIGTYPCVKYIYPFSSAMESLKILIDKAKNWDIQHLPFNVFWTAKIWLKEYRAARHFMKQWKLLAKDKKFRQLCNFKGTDVFDLISRQVKFYFLVLFPCAVKRIAISKIMFGKVRPDTVVLINEYGIFERALIIAAKQKGIPTIAIQHGNIQPWHQGYMYAKEDVSADGLVTSPYCPMPDRTAVYGSYFKKLLSTESAYPEDSLVITGQPRYDILSTLKEQFTAESILKEYNIPLNRKVILWTTQCIGMTEEENIANAKAFAAAFEQLDEVVLVIKQHPRERPEHLKILQKHLHLPKDNIVISPITADTLKLIHACDLMVTKFSTTAVEAIALDKALVLMNLTDEPDRIEYVKQGIAVGVYKPEDLAPVIRKIFNNETDMAEKRKEYIQRYLYRIDGQAASRVAGAIVDMLNNKN